MIDRSDLENLAQLARLELKEEEKDKLQKDLESILGYVSELDQVNITDSNISAGHALVTNIVRPDTNPNETGADQEVLLAEAPARSGDFVKVKPVLNNK
jgi:aspartyl-tRNA(Asn)/glutamyl-tRNA(Gln) amidotransferase subunit C